MMRARAMGLAALVLLAHAGCTRSTSVTGRPDATSDAPADVVADAPTGCTSLWDCNPGVPCGDMVACIDSVCRPDLAPIWIECPEHPCTSDADCIVADPYDCCNGCPVAIHREELVDHPCHHERGTPVGAIPEDCMILCYACPDCYPQPLGAVCRSGVCVASEEGCPYTGDEEPVPADLADVVADPLAYAGGIHVLTGSTLAVFSDCFEECLPPEPCCMADLHLGGMVRMEGAPCEDGIVCMAEDSCPDEWVCGDHPEGTFYEVTGEVRASYGRASIYVMGLREVPPRGLGGAYDVDVGRVTAWGEDPDADCAPVLGGDHGRIVVAEAGGLAVATANFLAPPWCTTFSGTARGASFQVWLDIDCTYCDYWLMADVDDGEISGTYHAFDGVCHTEATFTGSRI